MAIALPTAARSTRLHVAARYAVMGVGAVALAAVHIRHRPATLCLLRSTTGVPCPFCGGTTAAADLGRGDVAGGLRASPLAVAMLISWPLIDVVRSPAWWTPRRVRWSMIGAVLVAAELWQLARFGLLGG